MIDLRKLAYILVRSRRYFFDRARTSIDSLSKNSRLDCTSMGSERGANDVGGHVTDPAGGSVRREGTPSDVFLSWILGARSIDVHAQVQDLCDPFWSCSPSGHGTLVVNGLLNLLNTKACVRCGPWATYVQPPFCNARQIVVR